MSKTPASVETLCRIVEELAKDPAVTVEPPRDFGDGPNLQCRHVWFKGIRFRLVGGYWARDNRIEATLAEQIVDGLEVRVGDVRVKTGDGKGFLVASAASVSCNRPVEHIVRDIRRRVLENQDNQALGQAIAEELKDRLSRRVALREHVDELTRRGFGSRGLDAKTYYETELYCPDTLIPGAYRARLTADGLVNLAGLTVPLEKVPRLIELLRS